MSEAMTIGERVAWYRQRRGMPQSVLAAAAGRTVDWLSKVENNRIQLDRLSVIKSLADGLGVTIGDLLGEPSLLEWHTGTESNTIQTLREALLDYRQVFTIPGMDRPEPPPLDTLRKHVSQAWQAYQESRYQYTIHTLPSILTASQGAASFYDGDKKTEALRLLALTYHVASVLLTKIGEADLAWMAAERAFQAAQQSGDLTIQGSTIRGIIHALQATGRFAEATRLTTEAADFLQSGLTSASPEYLSAYGTVFLAGTIAAARNNDRTAVRAFLDEASEAARRLGADANHLWTAFGPTNVEIHRVTAAMDLGDVQVAIDLGEKLDPAGLPTERRVRHYLEVARALQAWSRNDEAIAYILEAERIAPEQVRYHAISRQIIQSSLRATRGKPSFVLSQLASRAGVKLS